MYFNLKAVKLCVHGILLLDPFWQQFLHRVCVHVSTWGMLSGTRQVAHQFFAVAQPMWQQCWNGRIL